MSDASVMRQVGASESGYDRREALERASFVSMKAARAESVQALLRTGEHAEVASG